MDFEKLTYEEKREIEIKILTIIRNWVEFHEFSTCVDDEVKLKEDIMKSLSAQAPKKLIADKQNPQSDSCNKGIGGANAG